MLHHPAIDPVALHLGPLAIRWYGLMYLLGFAAAWWLGRRRARRPGSGWQASELGDLIFYCAMGAVLGGRIGYVLFYQPGYYLSHPAAILQAWQGGMSFHGGLIGVLLACWLFGRKTGRGFFTVTDFAAPLVPTGLLAGRLGNFINGELWGGSRTCRGAWSSRAPARCRAIRRSFIRRRSKVGCCSSSCGCIRPGHGR